MSKEIQTHNPNGDLPAAATGFDRFIELALTKQVPVETLERLLAMQREIMATNAKAAYDEAMAALQAKMPVIPKNEKAGSGNFAYDYAPMDLIVKTVGSAIAAAGFSYSFDTLIDETSLTEIMTVRHAAGHAEKYQFKVPIDKAARMNDTQKVGSANTYAQRYVFRNGFGIMTGDRDEDGALATPGAAGRPTEPKTTNPPSPAPPAEKPTPPPTQAGQAPDGKLTATGTVINVEDLPMTKNPGKFRYKITLADQPKPFYSFDTKVRDLCHEKATVGPATITYHVGKYGQDIDAITFPTDPNAGFKQDFCGQENANK